MGITGMLMLSGTHEGFVDGGMNGGGLIKLGIDQSG